jgi:hypothetical protein
LACGTMERAVEIARSVPPQFDVFLARGLNDSPLLERLAAG